MNVLIACEESQRVCISMRYHGYKAYSCDIQNCSGGYPECHIKDDVLKILNGGFFRTCDNENHYVDHWDLIIAHPPCIYLTNCANRSHSLRCTPLDKINERTSKRIEAMEFFMKFVNADCDHIAIENPVGVMNTCYRKADQIIEPYQFAESIEDIENYVTKTTCLWLKGLPELKTNDLPKPDNGKLYGYHPTGKARTWEEVVCRAGGASKVRSKTFTGIAKAMADQWGKYVEEMIKNAP